MPTPRLYTSARKLNSLPVESRVRFGAAPYGPVWRKAENGWFKCGSSFPFPFSSADMIRYQQDRPYTVEATN